MFDKDKVYNPVDTPDFFQFLSKPLGNTFSYKITEAMRSALIELDLQNKKLSFFFANDLLAEFFFWIMLTLKSRKTVIPFFLFYFLLPQPSVLLICLTASENLVTSNDITKDADIQLMENISGLLTITDHCGKSQNKSNTAFGARNISADIDISNILFEGVQCQLKLFTQHNAYSTQLTLAEQSLTDTFRDFFAAFSVSCSYYNNLFLSNFSTLAISTIIFSDQTLPTQTHCDTMPLELWRFKKLARHFYCEFFKNTMRVKIEKLKQKNI